MCSTHHPEHVHTLCARCKPIKLNAPAHAVCVQEVLKVWSYAELPLGYILTSRAAHALM